MTSWMHGGQAVITGAAGGIGRATAVALAKHGCHVVLADRDERGLVETADLVKPFEVQATPYVLDVSNAEAVAAFAEEVRTARGGASLLINNAGVALGGTFEEVSQEDMEWLFAINFWGVVRMTRAFLPILRSAGDARLVNVSSLFGLIAPPGQATYAASKFAVRGFSDSLRKELKGSGVGVTVVHPGGVATGIAVNARRSKVLSPRTVADQEARFRRLARLSPERAGDIIVDGIARRRDRIIVGRDARLASLVERIAPVSYWSLIARKAL